MSIKDMVEEIDVLLSNYDIKCVDITLNGQGTIDIELDHFDNDREKVENDIRNAFENINDIFVQG